MRFEEKRRMGKEEVGRLLIKIGKKLEEEGILDFGRGALAIPPSIDVEIEYKEKHGKGKFEVELEWHMQEQISPASVAMPSLKEIKQGMKAVFRDMQAAIEGGTIPTSGQFTRFKELSDMFEKYAQGEAYGEAAREYLVKVAELGRAIGSGNPEDIKRCLEELGGARKSCHKMYR
jgi:XXXCH domain-containing protein